MSVNTDLLAEKYLKDAAVSTRFDPPNVGAFLAELHKDTQAAEKWLAAFVSRASSELTTLGAKLKKQNPVWASAVDSSLKDVLGKLQKYRTHPYAENIDFVSPFGYYSQEFDDPENYADGQERTPIAYDDLGILGSNLEATARNFTDRLLTKYGIRTRKNLKDKVAMEKQYAYERAWKEYFEALDHPTGIIGALKKLSTGLQLLSTVPSD